MRRMPSAAAVTLHAERLAPHGLRAPSSRPRDRAAFRRRGSGRRARRPSTQVGVGDGRLRRRRARSRPGPAARRRFAARRAARRPRRGRSSRRRCRPRKCPSWRSGPAAPARSRRSAPTPVVSGSPLWMTPALAVVPPMSKAMALSSPSARHSAWVPMTPAAGPDSSMRMQCDFACVGVVEAAGRLHDQERAAQSPRRGCASSISPR